MAPGSRSPNGFVVHRRVNLGRPQQPTAPVRENGWRKIGGDRRIQYLYIRGTKVGTILWVNRRSGNGYWIGRLSPANKAVLAPVDHPFPSRNEAKAWVELQVLEAELHSG